MIVHKSYQSSSLWFHQLSERTSLKSGRWAGEKGKRTRMKFRFSMLVAGALALTSSASIPEKRFNGNDERENADASRQLSSCENKPLADIVGLRALPSKVATANHFFCCALPSKASSDENLFGCAWLSSDCLGSWYTLNWLIGDAAGAGISASNLIRQHLCSLRAN